MHDDPRVTLPPIAARMLGRALHAASDAHGDAPAPVDVLRETGVCLDPDVVGDAEAAARLQELVRRARRHGASSPIVRLGEKEGATALLVSGDHVWRLVDAIHEQHEALEALAMLLAAVASSGQSAALVRRLRAAGVMADS